MSDNKARNYIPLVVAVSVVVGIVIGTFFANIFNSNRLSVINSANNKIYEVLYDIQDRYVDEINLDSLAETSIPRILMELDPHSTYTSAKEVEAEMQELNGSFSGIGVIFSIINDTARVIRVVPGGPSDDAGLSAGDRIVTVDGKSFVGDFLTNDYAMKHLKGPDKSHVKIGVLRNGVKGVRTFEIIRGEVPVKTITAYHMIDKTTGYIKIGSFGRKTYEEMLTALTELSGQGCKNLVVDLRENGGGYMDAAVSIANIFLPKNKMIVYAEGRKFKKSEYVSDGRGNYPNIPLVVLVDEMSASASEIFSAAMQDNDRAVIVGRRTFGKGLVQEAIELKDHSLLKLTVARYYSPSGRCLQKPYVKGKYEDYQNDLYARYQNGELYSKDSVHLTGKKFYTSKKRVVYEGGGVMPDEFIPIDTTEITSYLLEALNRQYIQQFSYLYADSHRKQFASYKSGEELAAYLNKQNLVEQFVNFAESKGLKRRNLLIKKSYNRLITALYYNTIDYILGEQEARKYINQKDDNIIKALDLIKRQKTFPANL